MRRSRRAVTVGAVAVAVAVALVAPLVHALRPAGAAIGAVLDPMISVRVRHVAGDAAATEKVAALAKLGSTLYVGGRFTELAPEREPVVTVPAGKGLPRANLVAVDAGTGAPVWSFQAEVNGPVHALEVDPVTNTLFVGGQFTSVNGQAVANLAILDATTGALRPTQLPVTGDAGAAVRALHLHGPTRKLYVGGDFTTVTPTPPGTNPRSRGELLRVDVDTMAVDSYRVQVTGAVLAIALDPAQAAPEHVYLGGEFTRAGPSPGDPSFAYLAAFSTTATGPESVGELRTAWDPSFGTVNPNNPPRVRSLAIQGGRVYAAVGGGGGRFTVFDQADGAANPVSWRTDGDVQVVDVVGSQVLVGGHFTRITNLPGTTQGQPTPYTLRCQLFAVPLAVAQADAPLATPNVVNSAHYGAFAVVAEGTDGDLNTYWGGHLGRITAGPDPTPWPAIDDAANGVCANGVQDTWGGLWHLRDTPQPDTTKPGFPGTVAVATGTSSATLTWPAATDASGIAAYYVYVNDVLHHLVPGNVTTTTLTGLAAGAATTVRVRAVDPGTNWRELPPVTFAAGLAVPALPSPLQGFGLFHPAPNPVRVLDTRLGIGRPGTQPLAAGAPLSVPVVGALSGVSADAQAVAMNVTVVAPSTPGWVTVAPTGEAMPGVSNVNFRAYQTVPNLVVARIGTGGQVDVQLSQGAAHVLFDVVGWFGSGATTTAGSRLATQAPVRKLDTRNGLGMAGGVRRPLGAGETVEVQVADPGVRGVVLNLTGVGPSATTYVTAYPGDQAVQPNASSLNLVAGQIRPNLVMVGVSPSGTVKLFNESGSVHLVVDVVGVFGPPGALDNDPTGRLLALEHPQRLVDTRPTGEALAGPGSAVRSFADVEAATVPPVQGLVMNVTATRASAPTYLTLYPEGSAVPNASNVNVGPGEDVPNLAVAALSAGDQLGVFSFAGVVDYVFDVSALVLG